MLISLVARPRAFYRSFFEWLQIWAPVLEQICVHRDFLKKTCARPSHSIKPVYPCFFPGSAEQLEKDNAVL